MTLFSNRISRRSLFGLAPLAVIIGLTYPGSADAALSIRVQIEDTTNGGVSFDSGVLAQSSFDTGFITVGEFTARVDSTSSQQAPFADLRSTSIDTALSTAASNSTLRIEVTVFGYSLPGSNGSFLELSSTATGGSTFSSNGQTAVLQSFADPTNAGGILGVPTPGQQTGVIANGGVGARNYNFGLDTNLSTNFTRGPLYSLTQVFLVTLNPDRRAELTLSTAVIPAVPEPGTVAMAMLGLPMMVLGVRRYRRKRAD